jgi:hypothetical protein
MLLCRLGSWKLEALLLQTATGCRRTLLLLLGRVWPALLLPLMMMRRGGLQPTTGEGLRDTTACIAQAWRAGWRGVRCDATWRGVCMHTEGRLAVFFGAATRVVEGQWGAAADGFFSGTSAPKPADNCH